MEKGAESEHLEVTRVETWEVRSGIPVPDLKTARSIIENRFATLISAANTQKNALLDRLDRLDRLGSDSYDVLIDLKHAIKDPKGIDLNIFYGHSFSVRRNPEDPRSFVVNGGTKEEAKAIGVEMGLEEKNVIARIQREKDGNTFTIDFNRIRRLLACTGQIPLLKKSGNDLLLGVVQRNSSTSGLCLMEPLPLCRIDGLILELRVIAGRRFEETPGNPERFQDRWKVGGAILTAPVPEDHSLDPGISFKIYTSSSKEYPGSKITYNQAQIVKANSIAQKIAEAFKSQIKA